MARPKGIVESRPRRTALRCATPERLRRLQSLGIVARTSDAVLSALMDKEYWLEIIGKLEEAEEWGLIADILKFHQQMRDGRPSQQINLTSMSVNISAEELVRTRSVVRELRLASTPNDTPASMPIDLTNELIEPTSQSVESETKAKHNALPGQGVERGGLDGDGMVNYPPK